MLVFVSMGMYGIVWVSWVTWKAAESIDTIDDKIIEEHPHTSPIITKTPKLKVFERHRHNVLPRFPFTLSDLHPATPVGSENRSVGELCLVNLKNLHHHRFNDALAGRTFPNVLWCKLLTLAAVALSWRFGCRCFLQLFFCFLGSFLFLSLGSPGLFHLIWIFPLWPLVCGRFLPRFWGRNKQSAPAASCGCGFSISGHHSGNESMSAISKAEPSETVKCILSEVSWTSATSSKAAIECGWSMKVLDSSLHSNLVEIIWDDGVISTMRIAAQWLMDAAVVVNLGCFVPVHTLITMPTMAARTMRPRNFLGTIAITMWPGLNGKFNGPALRDSERKLTENAAHKNKIIKNQSAEKGPWIHKAKWSNLSQATRCCQACSLWRNVWRLLLWPDFSSCPTGKPVFDASRRSPQATFPWSFFRWTWASEIIRECPSMSKSTFLSI